MIATTVSSGSARLRLDSTGSGPLAVFLHAGVADRRSWHRCMEAVAGRFRAVAYDRRGFGETRYEPEAFRHTGDLAAVLDALESDAAVLIGSSQGGRIAIDFALAHPGRVRALILIGTALTGAPEPGVSDIETVRLEAALEAAEAAGDLEAYNRLEARIWLDGPKEAEGRVGGAARELFLDMNRRALTAAPAGEEIEPPSALERLAGIAAPTLVVAGDRDFPEILEVSRIVAGAVPGAALEIMEGIAHLPQLEAPERLIPLLVDFLATV